MNNHKGEIAAVILEPIAGNMGLVQAEPVFLKELRQLCTEEGILLIFDEVISGFRVAYEGAQGLYCVKPDVFRKDYRRRITCRCLWRKKRDHADGFSIRSRISGRDIIR